MAFDLAKKKVAVTGGAGFLGRAVVARLAKLSDLEIGVPSSSEYDLRTEDGVVRFYDDYQPQVVIHLAATVAGIGDNMRRPGEFFYDNAAMGILLIEFARRYEVEKFVGIGTVCAYPKFAPLPLKEETIWDGYPEETNAPYGLSKKMTLAQSQAYRRQYGFNGIYLVLANLYGPGSDFSLTGSHAVPAILRKCTEAKLADREQVTLWGDGSPTREFLFVDDAADGIVQATLHYDRGEPVNLGCGREVSIRDLAHKIADIVGYRGEIVWDTSKPNGQPRRCLDTTRAKEWFGFEATTSLDDGLKATYEWYMRNRQEITCGA